MIAYCWANGVIGFGRSLPDGAIVIAKGPSRPLRAMVSVASRHAYDGKTLLVPGVPEAPDQTAGSDALAQFLAWLAPQGERGVTVNHHAGRQQPERRS